MIRKCAIPDASCPIHEKLALQSSSGRLVYLADLQWYTTNIHVDSFLTYYLVDANNGDVLFSSLLRIINGTNETSEYIP